jgi:hypothetical protein
MSKVERRHDAPPSKRGVKLLNAAAAKRMAVETAFAIAGAQLAEGKLNLDEGVDIEDEAGVVFHTIRFRDLIEMQGPPN